MAQKERERRKRGKRKYGQAKLKHSKKGIVSCGLSAGVLLVLFILIAIAYFTRGNAAPIFGAVGFMCMGASIGALYMGIRGFREREKDYLTCKIGIGCSVAFILSFIIIFCRGLF